MGLLQGPTLNKGILHGPVKQISSGTRGFGYNWNSPGSLAEPTCPSPAERWQAAPVPIHPQLPLRLRVRRDRTRRRVRAKRKPHRFAELN